VNQVTHWIDLSVVYDTSNEANQAIRAGSRGLLAFEIGPDGQMIMPGDSTPGRRCGPSIGKCFRAGVLLLLFRVLKIYIALGLN
jgi:hypothetical protein